MFFILFLYGLPIIILIAILEFLFKKETGGEKLVGVQDTSGKVSSSIILFTSLLILLIFTPIVLYGWLGFLSIWGIGCLIIFTFVMLLAYIAGLRSHGFTANKFYKAIGIGATTGLILGGMLQVISSAFLALGDSPVQVPSFRPRLILILSYWPWIALLIAWLTLRIHSRLNKKSL